MLKKGDDEAIRPRHTLFYKYEANMVSEIKSEDFDEKVANGLVVVDLWAPWCMPCKMIAPVIDELSGEYGGKIMFYKLNIDENQEPATKHQVMSIPTLLVFKDGQVADRIVGAMQKEKIKERLEKHL